MGSIKARSFLIGFTVGAAAGAGLGTLTTPARGQETRQRLGNQAPQLANRAGATVRRVLAHPKRLVARGLTEVGAMAGGAKARLLLKTD